MQAHNVQNPRACGGPWGSQEVRKKVEVDKRIFL